MQSVDIKSAMIVASELGYNKENALISSDASALEFIPMALVLSKDKSKYYIASKYTCTCKAFEMGKLCRHRRLFSERVR